jgi:hypothetical protein
MPLIKLDTAAGTATLEVCSRESPAEVKVLARREHFEIGRRGDLVTIHCLRFRPDETRCNPGVEAPDHWHVRRSELPGL